MLIEMMNNDEFVSLVMSFAGTEEHPHFDRRAYKVPGKRIFATLHEPSATANLKLTVVDQSVFSEFEKEKSAIYPVPNKWGLQGWTTFELKKVPKSLMLDALETAYNGAISPKRKN